MVSEGGGEASLATTDPLGRLSLSAGIQRAKVAHLARAVTAQRWRLAHAAAGEGPAAVQATFETCTASPMSDSPNLERLSTVYTVLVLRSSYLLAIVSETESRPLPDAWQT